MLRAIKGMNNDDHPILAESQSQLERKALRLAGAWTNFDMVETVAGEIIRRFGSINPHDLGVIRLHKHPLFVALQSAAVIGYVRPFIEDGGIGQIEPKYGTYEKYEWNRLHSELFVWQHRLTGEGSGIDRQFMIAPNDVRNPASGEFVVGEATSVLDPSRHFTLLRDMCTDRKAVIWSDLQKTLTNCYPYIRHPVLLSLKF